MPTDDEKADLKRAASEYREQPRPIAALDACRDELQQFVCHCGTFMKPMFAAAKRTVAEGGRARIAFDEGEDGRVLCAVQVVQDEGIGRPTLIARPAALERRLERLGLRTKAGRDLEAVNPEADARHRDCGRTHHEMSARRGVTERYAKNQTRRRLTLIGAMMIVRNDADGMICGMFGTHDLPLPCIDQVIGRRPGGNVCAAMNILMLPGRQIAMVDTHVNVDPTATEVAEIAALAAEQLQCLGIRPRVPLLSHSSFGSSRAPSAAKMRQAPALLRSRAPTLEVDGEMHAACAGRLAAPENRVALLAAGRCQSAGAAGHRCRQPRLQPAQDRGGSQRRDRPDPAQRDAARAHPHRLGNGAPDRQLDGAHRVRPRFDAVGCYRESRCWTPRRGRAVSRRNPPPRAQWPS